MKQITWFTILMCLLVNVVPVFAAAKIYSSDASAAFEAVDTESAVVAFRTYAYRRPVPEPAAMPELVILYRQIKSYVMQL